MFISSYQVQEASKSAQLRVRAEQENVSGVMLPTFAMYTEGGNGKYSKLGHHWNEAINGYYHYYSFWIHRLGSRWSACSKIKRGLQKSSRDPDRVG